MKRYVFWLQDDDESYIGTFVAEDITQASERFVAWCTKKRLVPLGDYQISEVLDEDLFSTPI